MLRICKSKSEIRSIEDWFRIAPPKKGASQWVDGRSAKELANAWFPVPGDPQIPPELVALLNSRSETADIVWEIGEPERVSAFDDCGGEKRNADLVLWGRAGNTKVLASIEAKADEPFGEVAGKYVETRERDNPRSRVPERFGLLCEGLLGIAADDERARGVRYQLLTGLAGAFCEAQECEADTTLFVVHEFTGKTDEANVQRNANDLNAFIRLVSKGTVTAIALGQLVGPVSVPGNKYISGSKQVFIGKCRRVVHCA